MGKAVQCSATVTEAFTDGGTVTSLPPTVKAKKRLQLWKSATAQQEEHAAGWADAIPTAVDTTAGQVGKIPQTATLKAWPASWYYHWAVVGIYKAGRSLGHQRRHMEVKSRTLVSSSSFFVF